MDGRQIDISPSPKHGLIPASLPEDDDVLRVYLGSTPIRDAAAAVSALAITLTLIAAWLLRKKQPMPRLFWIAPPLSRESLMGILLGGAIAACALLLLETITAYAA